ncbi:MAG: glutamate racemase [Oscillospiraceae bacterium]|nr:glutamate racemase [Oscillospiraceae bacterium]
MDKRPIGVFDSGLGGLTVVKELQKLLPNEDIVYFGDTGRVPYGTRSKETINKYALQDIKFLLQKEVKMVIAACGTVSAVLPKDIIKTFDFYYSGVLKPAVQAACVSSQSGRIGVIGTTATIKSGAYGKEIRNIRSDSVVIGNPCPLFVPLVENGFIDSDNQVTRLVAKQYLQPFIENDVDTLILGCTHFPLIKKIIGDIVGDDVTLIDPGKEAARSAAALLTNNNMLNRSETHGKASFYVSDTIESFEQTASVFLRDDVCGQVEKVDIDSL